MNYVKTKYRTHLPKKNTTVLREKIQQDLTEVKQEGRVLKAFDIFLMAKEQHEGNLRTARGIGATAAGVLAQTAQAAYDISKNCPPGADGASRITCALSTGNLVAAALGIDGVSVAIKILRTGRSHVNILQNAMDIELATKLRRHLPPEEHHTIESYGLKLVSDFARLTPEDQKIIRERLLEADPEPSAPTVV